ncbi:hypothetical protein H0H93_010260, partial [Arthromyces matolae]
ELVAAPGKSNPMTIQDVDPALFRIGQVVQVSMSFRTICIGRKHVPLLHLERLLLIDRIGTQLLEAEVEQQRTCSPKQYPQDVSMLLTKRRLDDDDEMDFRVAKRVREELEELACTLVIS